MDNNVPQYADFLEGVFPPYQEFVQKTNNHLLENGCSIKMKQAANGPLVSYSHNQTKRVLANFVFRKGGLVIRIYGANAHKYEPFLNTLPAALVKAVDKAPPCKRMADPSQCNSRCSMGYAFNIKDQHFQKCQYSCFMFPVNDESIPYIQTFLENELSERTRG